MLLHFTCCVSFCRALILAGLCHRATAKRSKSEKTYVDVDGSVKDCLLEKGNGHRYGTVTGSINY